MRFLCYHIIHKIVRNAEKNSFFAVFFIFFAFRFAYVKNLLYLCSRKGNFFTKTQYRLQFNHNNHEAQTAHTDDSLLPLHRTFVPP